MQFPITTYTRLGTIIPIKYKTFDTFTIQCLEIVPMNAEISYSYGHLLYLMGKYEQALEYIEIDIKLRKKKWKYFYQGLVYQAIGDKETSDEALLKAVESIQTREESE